MSVVAVSGCLEDEEISLSISSTILPNGIVDLSILNSVSYYVTEDEVLEISTQQPEISKILIFYQRLHLRTQTIMQKKNLVYILEFDILIQLNSSFNDNDFSVISKQDYLYIHVQYNE